MVKRDWFFHHEDDRALVSASLGKLMLRDPKGTMLWCRLCFLGALDRLSQLLGATGSAWNNGRDGENSAFSDVTSLLFIHLVTFTHSKSLSKLTSINFQKPRQTLNKKPLTKGKPSWPRGLSSDYSICFGALGANEEGAKPRHWARKLKCRENWELPRHSVSKQPFSRLGAQRGGNNWEWDGQQHRQQT